MEKQEKTKLDDWAYGVPEKSDTMLRNEFDDRPSYEEPDPVMKEAELNVLRWIYDIQRT